MDIHRDAVAVYQHNFDHVTHVRTIETLKTSVYQSWNADLWWLSPPCQPFTERGLGRDADDPRARPFLAVIEKIATLRPRHLALENVPGFVGSQVHGQLRETLDKAGYDMAEHLLCPSELGLPNRRRRFYLAASQDRLLPTVPASAERRPLRDFLDPEADGAAALRVDPEILRRYTGALHVIDRNTINPADIDNAVTNCFTSAYGRSHVRSGSYLQTGNGARRFSPAEILRLLGFEDSFQLPPGTSLRLGWRLVGNSLAQPAVRTVFGTIPYR